MISLCHGAKASGPENSCPRLHTAVNASPSLRFASSTLLRSCRVSPEGVSSDLHVFNTLPKHFPVSSNIQKRWIYSWCKEQVCCKRTFSRKRSFQLKPRHSMPSWKYVWAFCLCSEAGTDTETWPIDPWLPLQKDFSGDLIAWSLLCNRKRGDPGMRNDNKVGPT